MKFQVLVTRYRDPRRWGKEPTYEVVLSGAELGTFDTEAEAKAFCEGYALARGSQHTLTVKESRG